MGFQFASRVEDPGVTGYALGSTQVVDSRPVKHPDMRNQSIALNAESTEGFSSRYLDHHVIFHKIFLLPSGSEDSRNRILLGDVPDAVVFSSSMPYRKHRPLFSELLLLSYCNRSTCTSFFSRLIVPSVLVLVSRISDPIGEEFVTS